MPRKFKHLRFCGGMIFNWDGEKQVGTPIPMCGREDCEVCTGSSVPKEKRYDWLPDGTGYGRFKNYEPPAGRLYTANDFDRVTAERDAALSELKRYQALFNQSEKALDRVHCMYMKRLLDLTGKPQVALVPDEEFVKYFEELKTLKRKNSGLQQSLTAADERADVLEGLVGEVLDAVGREPLDLDAVLRLRARMRAALKPAEGLDRRDMSAKVRLMKREGGGDAARLALRPENQRITPARFKCLACGEYHEGSGNMPCPSMSPYSRIEQ